MRLGAIGLLLLIAVLPARAEEPSPAARTQAEEPSPEARTQAEAPSAEARALFEAGLEHARQGQWAHALAAFETAYKLDARASVLFNLAGAQLRAGKMLHAHANYERIRSSKDPRVTRTHKRAAEAQQRYIEQHIPRLRVQVEGLRAEDRVLLDKTRLYANELEYELWVDPGEHVLSVYRATGRQEVRHLALVQGQHQFVSLPLH